MINTESEIEIEFLDHIAIRVVDMEVSAIWYEKVLGLKRYTELNVEFDIQDHHYFDSNYTKDPGGHTVELTTIRVNENTFYK